MEEQKEKMVEVLEDGVIRLEFTIEEGYLVNIALDLKSKEDIGRIDIDDKVLLAKWLNNLKTGLFASISSQPIEVLDVSAPREKEDISERKCTKCGGDLVKKKPCCGNPNEILRCKKCGRNHRLVMGKMRGTVPGPSPFSSGG